jgi:hypothetical protein
MGKALVLERSKVVDRWSCLIESAQGNAIRIYRSIAAAILAQNIPEVYLERVSVRPKFWTHQEREYLLVTNQRLPEYPIYITAQDYGNNLAIYWYLVVDPALFSSLLAGDLHLFEEQELHAYVTVIHRCLRKAVMELLLSFGQDPAQLPQKSTGFLGVS